MFYPAVDIAEFDALVARAGGYQLRDQSDKVRFVYAGAWGNAYDVETIIACARLLADAGETRAEFLIAGNGPKAQMLHQMADGLPNVKLLGWLDAEGLAKLLAQAHVAIACYARNATQSVTYKLFDYLVAGLPIVCSLPGEMSELITREQVGKTYPPEDPNMLAKIVCELLARPLVIREMSARARAFAERSGDVKDVYEGMAEFLERRAVWCQRENGFRGQRARRSWD